MRYTTPIYFQTIRSEYDTATGNSGISILTERKHFADITETGTDMLQLLYGSLKQRALTIRLQRPFEVPFDRIRIGEKIYRVDRTRLNNKVFIVTEVQ